MEKEIIKLKGTGDGIKMYLDKDAPFSEILAAVNEKLKAWRSFFGSGHCHMYFVGRKLDKSDMLRLEAVVKALLPESTIIYGEKNIADTVQLPKQFLDELNKREEKSENGESADDSENAEENPENADADLDEIAADGAETDEISAEERYEFEKIKEVITTNYKSNRARLYEGVVKSGRVVESDGHLILVGSVEAGGTVIANGNVIVLGSLLGSAQAGCMGNANSYIIAMDMRPTDLRIAHMNKKYYNGELNKDFVPKQAFLTNNEICLKEFLLNI